MRNQRLTSFLLSFLFLNNAAFADVVIKGKASENITFYSGSTKTGQIDTTGTLTLPAGKTVENVGGGVPPGMVPVGGMVAVMPSTSGAWQPPATGVIKDGFMRADGGTVPSCSGCGIPAGTVLPNMVGSFAKGTATTTGTGTAYGVAFSGTATARSTWFGTSGLSASFTGTNASYSVSVPGHWHGFGTGSGLAGGEHNHTIGVSALGPDGNNYYRLTSNYQGNVNIPQTASGHGHTGSIGLVTGGADGNGPFTASGNNTPAGSIGFNAANDNMADWSAAGNYTPAGTVTGDPANVTVIWVIRVK